MKKYLYLIIIALTTQSLYAQSKLYFVKDSIFESKYAGKRRIFKTYTTANFTQTSFIEFEPIKINKKDSLDGFHIDFYMRNNTDSLIKLTLFTTSSGSNRPSFPKEYTILIPNQSGYYTIIQGFLKERTGPFASSGTLSWTYLDKSNKPYLDKITGEPITKNIALGYRFEIFK